jgi:hypothetical protein
MDLDEFSLAKQFAHVGETRVAYQDHGDGPPLVAARPGGHRHRLARCVGPGPGSVVGHDHGGDIPGVERVEILDNAGHLVMEDLPQRVADLLAQFPTGPTGAPDPLGSGSARP